MGNPLDRLQRQGGTSDRAASGMGLATAEAFAKAGAAVVLADKEEALRTAARLADRGHKAIAVGCDVSDDAQVAGMVERAVAQFGQLDAAMPASRPASSRQPTARARTGTA